MMPTTHTRLMHRSEETCHRIIPNTFHKMVFMLSRPSRVVEIEVHVLTGFGKMGEFERRLFWCLSTTEYEAWLICGTRTMLARIKGLELLHNKQSWIILIRSDCVGTIWSGKNHEKCFKIFFSPRHFLACFHFRSTRKHSFGKWPAEKTRS